MTPPGDRDRVWLSYPGILATCLLGLALAAAAGCHSARRSEPLVGPLVLADPSLQRGRQLFDRHCYKCHLQGEGGLSPAINNKPLPKFLMRLQVRAGLGAMPAFSDEQISEEELDDILRYLVELRHHTGKATAAAAR
jgi:cytochrome c5